MVSASQPTENDDGYWEVVAVLTGKLRQLRPRVHDRRAVLAAGIFAGERQRLALPGVL